MRALRFNLIDLAGSGVSDMIAQTLGGPPHPTKKLSPDAEEALEDKQRIRQLSERLKEQFHETLSDPLPVEIVKLVDQLTEGEFEDH